MSEHPVSENNTASLATSVLSDVIANLRNLAQAVDLLEQKEENSIYPLMKSNILYDIEKLERVMEELG